MIFTLFKKNKIANKKLKKVILIVLDGFGLAPAGPGNPITAENMPFLSNLISTYKSFSLVASGLVVGLEWGTFGNSEVGHGAIGTGRVIVQALARINNEIRNKKFFTNPSFIKVLEHAKKNNSKVHLIGSVSRGGIHSHEAHLIGLLNFFEQNKFNDICVHMITDGEDSVRDDALEALKRIDDAVKSSGAKIASIIGRNFGMDRVRKWSLTKTAWDVIVHANNKTSQSPAEYIKDSYANKVYDSEIKPVSIVNSDGKVYTVEDDDAIIFFNYRNDRMKQIAGSFAIPNFKEYDLGTAPKNLMIVTMTDYSQDFKVEVAYPPEVIKNTLGEVVSNKGLTQLRVAESEKEAHVTNFFDGGKLDSYPGEDKIIASSRPMNGEEYLEHPEMSADKITNTVIENLGSDYSLYAVNFANSDMVAHTGNIEATVKALKFVDKSLEKIISSVNLDNSVVIITADHGNAEELLDPSNDTPDTQHSTANVPIVFVTNSCLDKTDKNLENLYKQSPRGALIDVAPTVLHFLDIKVPGEMTGSSLI